MVWVRTDINNTVIDVSNEEQEGWSELDMEGFGPLDIINAQGEYIWKLVYDHLELRTNEEIRRDKLEPLEIIDTDSDGDDVASLQDRIAILEQELELLLSGEVE